MLHILWKLLIWILILIGILLGLLFIVVLLMLFCPVKYKVFVQKEESDFTKTKVKVLFSWLFSMIRMESFLENGKWNKRYRIFGILIDTQKKKRKKKKRKEISKKELETNTEKNRKTDQKEEKTDESLEALQSEYFGKNENILDGRPGNLKNNGKIKVLLQKIYTNIQSIFKKTAWWKQFLETAYVQEAFLSVKKDLTILWKHIFPKTMKGHIKIGNENPAVTGTILALLGITIPFHKNKIQIQPLFDGENVLEGRIYAKGRIYGIVVLVLVLRIFFNKKVKDTIHYWKNKEEIS